jgi:hypothetical protein
VPIVTESATWAAVRQWAILAGAGVPTVADMLIGKADVMLGRSGRRCSRYG